MKIIDISWPLVADITEYKNRKTVTISPIQGQKEYVRETMIGFNVHTGTHVDAPFHFVSDGVSIDQIPLQALIGQCIVLDMMHVEEKINVEDLESYAIEPQRIILFKTKNSLREPTASFDPHFVYVDADAAAYLASKKIKAVGIDYLGIERNQPDHATHKHLLHAQIPIIEGLRLAHVQPGSYTFWCLPLAFVGIDAAPARAVLLQHE